MKELTKLNPEAKIAESNKLLREMVSKQTSKIQLDIILSVIALTPYNSDSFIEYQISIDEFCKLIGGKDARKYKKNVINAIDCIMDCKFWIHEDGVHTCYHFVDKSQFDENKNIVSFKVSNEVAEFFLNLKDSPTFYALKDMLALSTIFQANVFSWLSAERNKTKPRIDIDTAKTIFNNEKEIQNKRFIAKLDDAIAAINRKTSLEVSYNKIVKGRKLIALEFNIKNHYKKTK